MRKNKFIAVLLAAAFLLSACASLSRSGSSGESLPSDPNIVSGTLENGMTWFVAKNSEPRNRLYLRLAVRAGAVLEDDDQKGVAHFVEHMAFNGTENFAKNELIDYFESIGMSFGPEVNAYTGFDETVYMLEIPADDPAILEKSLLVLHDWASAISFEQAELDKERGVVVEEWRLGRGAQGRILDKEIPFLFDGSRYASRLPIGDPEIVKTVSRARVTDFYNKWYRTDLMSVVVVGDADPALLSEKIAKAMGSIPAAEKKAKREYWPVQAQKDAGLLVIRDPEIQYTTVQLMEQYPSTGFATTADLRRQLVQNIAFSVFNSRLSEKTLVADPLMLGAMSGLQRMVRPTVFTYTGMVPSNGNFEPALSQLLEELERFEKFGITDAELERAKSSMLDGIKQVWIDREKFPSASYIGGITESVLYGETSLSLQDQYDLYNRIVPEISAKEVSGSIGEWYTGRGKLLLVTAPESASDIPGDAALKSLWQDWKPSAELAAYTETGLDRPLFAASGERGKIVKEEKLSSSGIRQWTLSNGARVVVYPTSYKANEIRFTAWSKGGTSLASDADYPSAAVATSYAQMSGLNGFSAIDLQKKLSGKTVEMGVWLDEAWEGLYGSSSVADLETMFQLINLEFTAPEFSNDAWESLYAQLETVSDSRKNDPGEMFADLKVKLLYGDNIRRSNLTPALVSGMVADRAEAAYRARFADAGDFTFAFVGSFDEAKLRDFAETYLAVLPSSGKAEDARKSGIAFPEGLVEDTLSMGIDPKARVFVAFGGASEISDEDFELYDMACSLLDIRLREVIREDMSGSYGVQVYGSLVNYPESRFETRIEFGCDPARVEELSRVVFDQVEWMKSAPIDEKYVTKLRENFRRSQEEGLEDNGYWLGQIQGRMMSSRDLDAIAATDAVLSRVTGENLQKTAQKYFAGGNCVRAFLLPKK